MATLQELARSQQEFGDFDRKCGGISKLKYLSSLFAFARRFLLYLLNATLHNIM